MLASERLAKQISQTVGSATELQALRDRVAELEELIGARGLERPIKGVHLTDTEEKTLAMLLKRPIVTLEAWDVALHGDQLDCDRCSEKMLAVYVLKLRRKLAAFGIEISVRWGVGYYLTAENKAKLAALLADRV